MRCAHFCPDADRICEPREMRSISCPWPLQSGWVGGTNAPAPPRVELASPNASSVPILRVEPASSLAVVAAAGGGVGAAAGGAADLGAVEVGAVEVGADALAAPGALRPC